MSKTLGIISIVIMAATAFIAMKNKQAYEIEIDSKKSELLREESTKEELIEKKQRIADATALKEGYEAKTAEVQIKLDDTLAEHEDLKGRLSTLEAEFNFKEEQLTEANAVFEALPSPKELVPKVLGLQEELAELEGEIATEEARLANLTSQDNSGKAQIGKVRELIALQSNGKSFPSLNTRVSGVYPDLGFVVLAAGDKQGVVTGSTLNVIRSGEIIGKLKVTAVEPGRSSANIILGSVADGDSVRSGDKVVSDQSLEVAKAQ